MTTRINSSQYRHDYSDCYIEDVILNEENAEKLARCLNSFDNSDSWPGGFTRGNPFTAQRILDELAKNEAVARLVVFKDEKIVGISIIEKHWRSPNSYYVGLLGVDPDYQKRCLGKRLLQCSVELATHLKANRLDLHTWEGNLKAMPLYKRTGFNWYPNTSVLMENYIPQFLIENFSAYINMDNWYKSLNRKIEQEPDIHSLYGTPLFKYHFDLLEGKLDINVDIESKKTAGFKLDTNELRIEIQTFLKSKNCFIGSKSNVLICKIQNNSTEKISIKIKLVPTTRILLTTQEEFESIILLPSQSKELTFDFSIDSDAIPVDKSQFIEEQTQTNIQSIFLVTTEAGFEKEFTLYAGIVTKEPFSIGFIPELPVLRPNNVEQFKVYIKNQTLDNQNFKLILNSPDIKLSTLEKSNFVLNPGKSISIPIEATVADSLDNCELLLEISPNENFSPISRSRYLPITGSETGISTCSLPNREYTIENNNIRVFIQTKKECMIKKIYNKKTDETNWV